MKTPFIALGGGIDLVTPPIKRAGGRAIAGINYLPSPEGYERFGGFERFDGRALPSSASFWRLGYRLGTVAFAAGDVVTGATSGAAGTVLVAPIGTVAAGTLILTAVSGAFVDAENLTVSGVARARADGVAAEGAAATDAEEAGYRAQAVERQRAAVGAVPGTGPIRAIHKFGGKLYALRDHSGSECRMYRADAGGWTLMSLGAYLPFRTGSVEILAGDVVTGATSGATATVTRVARRAGAWSGTAEGTLAFNAVSGTFATGEAIRVGGANRAVAAGPSAACRIVPGPRHEIVTTNFFGAADRKRMYGVTGGGPAWEFDGTTFVPILTGMAADAPTHVAAHSNYLFLAFPGGSLQFSGIGDPYAWAPVLGAGEIGLGEEITALCPDFAGVMAVLGRNKLAVLYGTVFAGVNADAEFKVISSEAGGIAGSAQVLGQPVFMDDRGIRRLSSVQEYGDFRAGTMSKDIKPLLDTKRKAGATVTCSQRVRERDQYRVFFSDGSGLAVDASTKDAPVMPLSFGRVVRCAATSEAADGSEELWFGSDDGYVFRSDSGGGADGADMDCYVRLAFNHLGTPRQNKRFAKAVIECKAAPTTTLKVLADYSYGDPDQPALEPVDFALAGGGGFFDEANWNEFYWSAQVEGTAVADLDGIGTTISVAISSRSRYEPPHVLHGLTIYHSPRGLAR